MSKRSNRRAIHSRPARAKRTPRRAGLLPYVSEALERRVLLAGTPAWVLGAPPTWKDEGPIRQTDSQVQGMDDRHNPISGAVNAIAPDPVDYAKIYIARTVATTQTAPSTHRTPLVFQRNEGQANASVLYASLGADVDLSLLRHGAFFNIGRSSSARANTIESVRPSRGAGSEHVSMRWLGGNPHPSIIGLAPIGNGIGHGSDGEPARRLGIDDDRTVAHGDLLSR